MRSIYTTMVIVLCLGTSLAQTRPIDSQHSFITVHVFKSGLFAGFADNHEIRAPIASGSVDETAQRVEVMVDSRKLVVLDPNLPANKKQQVQDRMLGPEVLDASQFQEIRFAADDIKQETPDRFLVSGTLSLHGKTRPISMHVIKSNDHYRGETMLKQSEFGITPVSIAGGTVKVKDVVRIEFDIVIGLVSAASKRLRTSLMNVSKADTEMQSKGDGVSGWTAGWPIKSHRKHGFHKIRLKELGSVVNRPCLIQKRSEAHL
jgi:polyisoprenoid-binding protein YceI